MAGRPFKPLEEIERTLFAVMSSGVQAPLVTIKMKCPACGSWMVRTNGTKMSGRKRMELFMCKNPECMKERREREYKKEYFRNFPVSRYFYIY